MKKVTLLTLAVLVGARVTAAGCTSPPTSSPSPSSSQPQTSTAQFNDVGTFPYHCTPHPFMKGTITVQ